MEPDIWTRFVHFVRDSYHERIKQTASGLFMGFIAANNLLFSGELANLVGIFWWIIKGLSTVILAFFTSLATSYAAYLIEKNKNDGKKSQKKKTKR